MSLIHPRNTSLLRPALRVNPHEDPDGRLIPGRGAEDDQLLGNVPVDKFLRQCECGGRSHYVRQGREDDGRVRYGCVNCRRFFLRTPRAPKAGKPKQTRVVEQLLSMIGTREGALTVRDTGAAPPAQPQPRAASAPRGSSPP